MSKYKPLWDYLEKHHQDKSQLTFAEIKDILGFEMDHSFLTYKKEAQEVGYQVGKISMKEKTVTFF